MWREDQETGLETKQANNNREKLLSDHYIVACWYQETTSLSSRTDLPFSSIGRTGYISTQSRRRRREINKKFQEWWKFERKKFKDGGTWVIMVRNALIFADKKRAEGDGGLVGQGHSCPAWRRLFNSRSSEVELITRHNNYNMRDESTTAEERWWQCLEALEWGLDRKQKWATLHSAIARPVRLRDVPWIFYLTRMPMSEQLASAKVRNLDSKHRHLITSPYYFAVLPLSKTLFLRTFSLFLITPHDSTTRLYIYSCKWGLLRGQFFTTRLWHSSCTDTYGLIHWDLSSLRGRYFDMISCPDPKYRLLLGF